MPNLKGARRKVTLFGHFGTGNFGNEITLQAILCHIRRFVPDAEISCICSSPEIVAANYNITAVPISGMVVKPWRLQNPVARMVRKVLVGIPSELYRWFKGAVALRGTDILIVAGTGMLTDAFGIGAWGWGPYCSFKWSVLAKLCGCRLMFVSVGAGPLSRRASTLLVKSSLALANFRSYRDQASLEYLKGMGFHPNGDRVYPDLVFSLPGARLEREVVKGRRHVVGLGLMLYDGMYGIEKTTRADYAAYLETLATFVEWLLERDYDVRLIVGDLMDAPVMQEFIALLRARSVTDEVGRIVAEPIASPEDLLSQLAATDFVVATRFHNVLLALLLNKPAIAISFHHKCSSLMSQMGLSEYSQDINCLKADLLIEQFCELEKNAETLKPRIKARAEEFRKALDEQYEHILGEIEQARA